MYIVPTGDNPCGGTLGVTRKQEIYAICVEYGTCSSLPPESITNSALVDIIIVEDDPYFFLQEGIPYAYTIERTTWLTSRYTKALMSQRQSVKHARSYQGKTKGPRTSTV
jgi:DNA-binding transcriptional MocR family regulator